MTDVPLTRKLPNRIRTCVRQCTLALFDERIVRCVCVIFFLIYLEEVGKNAFDRTSGEPGERGQIDLGRGRIFEG